MDAELFFDPLMFKMSTGAGLRAATVACLFRAKDRASEWPKDFPLPGNRLAPFGCHLSETVEDLLLRCQYQLQLLTRLIYHDTATAAAASSMTSSSQLHNSASVASDFFFKWSFDFSYLQRPTAEETATSKH